MGLVLAISVATGVALWAVGWISSAHRAQRAADVLALAVVVAQGDCSVAEHRAADLQVQVQHCTVRGVAPNLVATLEVTTPLRPVVVGAPRTVSATAAAASGDLTDH